MLKNLKTLLVSAILATFILPSFVSAQTVISDGSTVDNSSCISVNSNLSYAKRRTNNQEDVYALQDFLNTQGYLNDSSITGFFGKNTLQAVKNFQSQVLNFAAPVVDANKIDTTLVPDASIRQTLAVTNFVLSNTGNVGAYTRAKIAYASCSGLTTTQTTSTTVNQSPTVEFIGTPTLSLQYDSNNKESILVGKATVKITAGGTPMYDTYRVSGILQLVSSSIGSVSANSMTSVAASEGICLPAMKGCVIPAYGALVYNITETVKPAELFAGSYFLKPVPFGYSDSNNMEQTVQPVSFKNAQPSNSVTVIGETSPYISSVACDSTPNVNCGISGSRFNPISNTITVGNVTKEISSTDYSWTNSTGITFQMTDFGITQAGSYNVQVKNSNGVSNNFVLTSVGVNSSQNSSAPTAVVISGPTMSSPVYDSSNKEVSISANTTVSITAGNTDIKIVKPIARVWPSDPYYFNLNAVSTDGNNGIADNNYNVTNVINGAIPDYAIDNGDYWTVKAGMVAVFNLSQSFNVKKMFAGYYRAIPYLNDFNGKNILASKDGNSVKIIGETAPYITAVAPYMSATSFVIKGVRFNSTSNSVTINNITKNIASANGTLIGFKTSDFGITQNGTYFVQVSTSEGASNSFTFNFGIGTNATTTLSQVTFAKTAGMVDQIVSPNTSNVKIGSFTVQTGAQSISVKGISVNTEGSNPMTNYSNLVLKSGTRILGTPVGAVVLGSNMFNFSPIVIPANSTQVFDAYADIGSASSGYIKTGMGLLVDGTGFLNATGVNITSANATLANPTLSPTSPVSQFVVGGISMNIATFKLKTATTGTNATVNELTFGAATVMDAIESITVGGRTVGVNSYGNTIVTGLNIPVTSTGTDVPVTVKFAGFQGSTNGGILNSGVSNVGITLTSVQSTSGSGAIVTNTTAVSSNKMTLVASKPTVTMSSGNTSPLILGAENKIGEFTVTADANGKIALSSVFLNVSATGYSNLSIEQVRVTNGSTPISGVTSSATSFASVLSHTISFAQPYEISAGQSVTFSVYAVVNGTAQAAATPVLSSSLNPASFVWRDIIGGNTQYTGSNLLNFPTNSYTTSGGSVSVVSTPAPTLTLTASQSSVTTGRAVTLNWSSTNASSCSAEAPDLDGWWGAKATSGSYNQIINYPSMTFTLSCVNSSGVSTGRKSVTVTSQAQPVVTSTQSAITVPVPAPIVNLSTLPSTVNSGQSSTVSWSTSNTARCTLDTGSFDDYGPGSTPLNGSKTLSALTVSRNISLSCVGTNGTTLVKTATVIVSPAVVTLTQSAITTPAPTVTVTALPTTVSSFGTDISKISWSSTGAISCSLSGDPGVSSAGGISGSVNTYPIGQNTTINVTCIGAGGSTTKSVTVTVSAPVVTSTQSAITTPAPIVTTPATTLSFSSSKTSYVATTPAVWSNLPTLTWSSNATSCAASGAGWSGTLAASGSQTVSPYTTTTYTLTCGSAAPQSITINVSLPPSYPSSSFNQMVIGGKAFDITAPATCKTLLPISKGSWDSNSNGSVTALQKFLAKKYNLNTSDVVSGYYGDQTKALVAKLQTENGLEAVGYLGSATRELIKNSCTQ